MHINPITINTKYNSLAKDNTAQKKQALIQNSHTKITPSYAHYISFMGGSSLDLKQSVENLDKISDSKGEKFPPDIYQDAIEVIRAGNPQNQTLVDIHKGKYSLLEDCYDLDDARALFDEFSDVLSDAQVDYKDDSFIGRVKAGEYENFSKDEDLAFQLLKLYWAQGFSLNDLKDYTGVNLHYALKKFNIPLMDRDYAHVLKFSDKEYNERLTSQMAQKRMEARDRQAQKQEGEPVYIPRGPLSEVHKKHISDGLIKYYAEHPQKSSEMSERQKKYFEDNPEQKELLRKAMLFAWNDTQEGRSIKKHLVKFFRKNKVNYSDDILLLNLSQMSKSQQEIFADFWKKNRWAGEIFSKAVSKGWEQVKNSKVSRIGDEDNIHQYKVSITPKKYVYDVADWCKRTGVDTKGINFDKVASFDVDFATTQIFESLNNSYIEANPTAPDLMTSSLGGALMSIGKDIKNDTLPKGLSFDKDFLAAVSANIKDFFFPKSTIGLSNHDDLPRIVGYNEVADFIQFLGQLSWLHRQPQFLAYMEQKINKSYELICNSDNLRGRIEYLNFIGEKP